MMHFLAVMVAAIVDFFGWLYDADERPEARRITLGCAGLALLVAVAIALAASR
jgi:hypothetical protein